MKICFLAGTLGRGGAERQLLYMLRALKQADVATRVLCLTTGEFFETEIKDLGIQIDWIGQSQNRLVRLLAIAKNLKQQPADVLQSAHFYTNIYVGLTGRKLKIPSIGAIRSDLKSEMAAHKLLGKYQLSLPTHLLANTETARRLAINQHNVAPTKIEVIKNAVETKNDFSHFKNAVLNILFVGRLVKLKRPDLFVKLASLLENELPNHKLNFQVAGDGPLRAELEQFAADLKLKQNQVSFLGWQNEMDEIYRRADILVLTSEYEGSPNVLLEAMSFSVPAIATNVGGVAEILNASNGFLLESTDEATIVGAIKKLILNPDLRAQLGIAGRQYVIQNHSHQNLKNQLNNLYSKLT